LGENIKCRRENHHALRAFELYEQVELTIDMHVDKAIITSLDSFLIGSRKSGSDLESTREVVFAS
jgi:hypothetical protein